MTQATGTILDAIVAARLERVRQARRRRSLAVIKREAEERTDFRNFEAALRTNGMSIIAEMKKASPSAGVLRREYRCRDIARAYQSAGAAALSVLTEENNFQGSLSDLSEARAAVRLPVLRKDFIVDEYQVYESAAAGVDALLLIVAALDGEALARLLRLASHLRVAPLVEVHTEAELSRALRAGAQIVGVNNRNLKTLAVDLETSLLMRSKIPSGCLTITESGIRTAQDLRRLAEAGYDAALIGEHFMRSEDPGAALSRLLAGDAAQ